MKKRLRSAFLLESLEPRLLFSADMALVPVDGGVSKPEGESDLEFSLHPGSGGEQEADVNEQLRQEIVFVDEAVDDLDQLIADLKSQFEKGRRFNVVTLDSDRDGIAQISAYLNQHQDVAAVHVISHGADGEVVLGNSRLNSTTLDGYAEAIEGWQQALSGDADLLFYGCNLAASNEGQDLFNSLTMLTGADVAASDDVTGSAQFGGDWALEYSKGQIETAVAINSETQQNWNGVLATFNVTTTADGGAGSLRQAIIDANALGGTNEIILGAGTYTLSLGPDGDDAAAFGDLDITSELTITGAGAGITIIDGGGLDRVFDVHPSGNLTMSNVTVQGGNTTGSGGGIRVTGGGGGGRLNLDNVIVRNNTASNSGGGIYNDGIVTLTDVEFSGNTTSGTGGGFFNTEQATLERVTISGNSAADGAGIYNSNQGNLLELTNVTISGNTATANGGGIYTEKLVKFTNVTLASNLGGGGVYVFGGQGEVQLKNSILANNTGGNSNQLLTSQGYNIEDGDLAFTPTTGDQPNTDPLLGPLQLNGGFAPTHALLAGSPAIDPAGLAGAPPLDQRGASRDGMPDIGAFEYGVAVGNNPGTVTIDNITPAKGDTLTANVIDPDGVSGAISYQWRRDGVSIAGATAVSYTTVQADVGTVITVTADYTDDLLNIESLTSAGTAAVTDVQIILSGTSVAEMAINGTSVGSAAVSGEISTGGDFLGSGTPATYTTYNSGQTFSSWTVTSGQVDLLGSSFDVSPQGGNSVDLGGGVGGGGQPGTISQTLTTVAGQQYEVTFASSGMWAFGATTMDLRISFGSLSQDISIDMPVGWSQTDFKWTQQTLNFTASSSSTDLSFASLETDGEGPIVGDISVIGPSAASYTYTLIDDAGGRFDIHPTTGEVTVADGSLLDYENASSHDITVRASLGASVIADETFTIQVTDVNDAPTLSGGPYNLGSTDEDNASTGVPVTTILGGLTSSDADGDTLGIAVVTANGNGTWQYSTNSTDGTDGAWTGFGSVNGSSALLLAKSSWVRYVPDGQNGENVNIDFHAWDGTSGTASIDGTPSTADPAGGGGTTAYSSGIATANLTVTAQNDAPTITSVANTAATEDLAYSYTFTVNDVDVGDTLTLSAPTLPAWLSFDPATGILSGTPTNAEVGDHAVVLRVNDGTVNVDQSFTITVANTNDAPIITSVANTAATEDSAYSYTFTVNDVDVGDTLTLSAPTLPAWLSFDPATGILSGTPTNAEVGDHVVVLRVNDGTVNVDQSFTITVANTNDAPTITSVANTAATEDSAYSYTFTVNDVDVGDTLTLSAPTLPAWLSFDPATGILSGTPTNAEVGDHAVVLRVNDGTVDVDQSFTITVANTNDAPIITSVANTAATEDSAYSYTFTVNDVDVGDTLTLSAPTLPAWLSFDPATGILSGTPTNAEVGDHAVVLRVNDGTVNVDQSFTITVANVNDAGTVTIDNNTPARGDTLTASVTDPDGATGAIAYQWYSDGIAIGGETTSTYTTTLVDVGTFITVTANYTDDLGTAESLTSAPTAAVTNINSPGTVTIDNMAPAQGDTLTSSVTDPDGASGAISYQWYRGGVAIGGATGNTYTTVQADVGTVMTVTADYTDDQSTVESLISAATAAVTNVNDNPVAVNDNLNATEDNSMTITSVTDLLGNDSDMDGDALTLSGFSQPANGMLVDNADGTLGYTPGGDFCGIDSFTYTISDGNSGTADGTAIIVVAPVGDTPRVTNVSTSAEVQSGLIFINRNASDGAEVSHFKISGISNGSLYLADGVTGLDNGDFISVAQGQAGLKFTPAEGITADGSFNVESSEDGVSVASQSGIATSIITILPSASPPAASEPGPPPSEPEPVTEEDVVEEETEATDDLVDETDVSTNADNIFSVAKPQSTLAPNTVKPDFIPGVAAHNQANSDSDDDKTTDRSTLLSPQTLKMLLEAQNLGELKTALGKLDITTLSPDVYELVRGSLDAVKEEMGNEILLGKTVLGSAMATTVGLSAGYVVWMLKGGSLLASVLSSLPAWQLADPLAILVGKKDDDDDDDESLETIIEEGSARDKDKKNKASELNNLGKESAKR